MISLDPVYDTDLDLIEESYWIANEFLFLIAYTKSKALIVFEFILWYGLGFIYYLKIDVSMRSAGSLLSGSYPILGCFFVIISII